MTNGTLRDTIRKLTEIQEQFRLSSDDERRWYYAIENIIEEMEKVADKIYLTLRTWQHPNITINFTALPASEVDDMARNWLNLTPETEIHWSYYVDHRGKPKRSAHANDLTVIAERLL